MSKTESIHIVIVGGVAGGASAAARARRVNANAKITLIERGPNVSFANCGLPYHVGGEIASREDLLVVTADLFRERFGIDVRLETEAQSIDRDARTVKVSSSNGGDESIHYDRLILSPGAEPIRPGFVDASLPNVGTLWSLADMDRLIAEVKDRPQAKTVVVGGGFVGIEVAEQLAHRGLDCVLIELADQVLGTLDAEMAGQVATALEDGGVTVRLGVGVESIESRDGRAVGVQVAGEVVPADLVVLAIGVRPRTELATAAGLELGPSRGIKVDSLMQTSDPNILAVGDCVEYEHAVLGRPALVQLAGPANRAGRIAGTIAAGGKSDPMRPVLGTSVVRVFDLTAASTGLNQRQCDAEGIESRAVYVEAMDHASYFPGAQRMLLKLVYTPDGKIIGAQAVGRSGVDKRIDVIATAMAMDATVHDLAGIDLAYAPPFGSAKDPVHMAAFVACNDLAGLPGIIPPDIDLDPYQVVDVRSASERERLPIPDPGGTIVPIPIDELPDRMDELDQSKPTVTMCHSGKRAHLAASQLATSGFADVRNLTGGVSVRRRFFPTEKG